MREASALAGIFSDCFVPSSWFFWGRCVVCVGAGAWVRFHGGRCLQAF